MIVCNRENKQCMVHRCPQCPGINPLIKYLNDSLLQLDPDNKSDNEEDNIQISFKQWTTTDRTELVARCESVTDFIE